MHSTPATLSETRQETRSVLDGTSRSRKTASAEDCMSAPGAEAQITLLSPSLARTTSVTTEEDPLRVFFEVAKHDRLVYHQFAVIPRPFVSSLHSRPDIFNHNPTPYSADGFHFLLSKYNLLDAFPFVCDQIRFGFPMGNFPPLLASVIFPNHFTCKEHPGVVDAYIAEEVAAGRMTGPCTRSESESHLRGPIQVRLCRHLSKESEFMRSVNSHIAIEKFLHPTLFDSAAKMGYLVSFLFLFPSITFERAKRPFFLWLVPSFLFGYRLFALDYCRAFSRLDYCQALSPP